jgi:pre-mRNA-splicing factor SYF1
MKEGRQELRRLLDEAPEAHTLTTLYQLAVEVEDQLVESFAVDPAIRQLDDAAYTHVVQHLFSSTDPLVHLSALSREFPLLLNQAQLRNSPYNTALWLKRAELVLENVYAGRSTLQDVQALYRQAIQQCASGMSRVDGAAAQLFHSCAQLLLRAHKVDEAVALLHDGGWCTPFTSTALNVQLVGLWAEVQLMASPTATAARDALASKLTSGGLTASASAGGVAAAKRSRAGLLQSSTALPEVVRHPHVWTLWCDLCAACDPADEAAWRQLVNSLACSKAFTAETACYVARRAYGCGHTSLAVMVLERGVAAFRSTPTAQLCLLEQYLSFICVLHGSRVPLHQFRELFSLVEQVTPAAIRAAPSAVIDLHFSCADMEATIGLYGTAVRVAQAITTVAITALRNNADHLRLLQAALEHSISFTERFKGYDAVRTYCGDLVRRLRHPLLLQRVVLHWAAIEKRSGNATLAHTIMDACSDSQDPATPHGEVYWRLWESLCTQRKEFENVARRRQQASIRFAESS